MRRVVDVLISAAIVAALAAGIALYLRFRDKRIEERALDKKEIAAFDSTRDVQTVESNLLAPIATRTARNYRVTRDRILRENPESAPAKELATVADTALESAAKKIRADSSLIATSSKEIARLQDMKFDTPPRVSLWASGGYDFIQKEPVSKMGAEIRIFEPLSINAYVEARTSRLGRDSLGVGRHYGDSARVRISGVVEAKITFR